jgi:hypothetical protein
MTTLTIPKSIKKSLRLTFIAASLAVLASCGSTDRTALTPGVEAQSSAAEAPAAAPSVATAESTTTQPPETTATVAPTLEPVTTVPVTAATVATTAPVDTAPSSRPTPPPPTVTAPASPTSADPIAAVDANGNPVLVGGDGARTVLVEGIDPDDPLPEEGTIFHVAGIAVTDDLSTRIVGTCCEPVPGWLSILDDDDTSSDSGNFGHAPVISPDQTRLAAITVDSVYVSRLDFTGLRDISIETAGAEVLDIEWIDDVNIVVLVSSPTEAALYRYQVTDAALVATSVVSVPVASALAGVNEGIVYALGATNTLTAYAVDGFGPVPDRDIVLPVVPLSASLHDGELRWIDQERNLHVGDTLIPGQYIWIA